MEKEIYKTLAYADVFDYPLTGNQIFQTVGVKVNRKKFLTNLKKIPHVISNNLLYYFLPRRENIVLLRKQKEKYSLSKIRKAKKIVRLLSFIPTIRFIGISGSVAMHNADRKSDIDLFFITTSKSVWITRFFVYCLLQILGKRRKKGQSPIDSFCANMFIAEDSLRFPLQKRNLYVAHEIIQVLPLFNTHNTHEKFLQANIWIQNYFPNISIKKTKHNKKASFSLFFLPLEFFMRKAQIWYMGNKRTRETITPSVIAFHPIDYEQMTLDAYRKKVSSLA